MGRSIHTKPAVSAWLIRERKRLGWKPRDVADALTTRGLPVQEGTVRTWEAGRNPSPENVEGLEAIFESRSPASGPGDATPPGLDAHLIAEALDRQTAVLTSYLERLQEDLAQREQRVSDLELLVYALIGRVAPGEPTPTGSLERELLDRLGADAVRP